MDVAPRAELCARVMEVLRADARVAEVRLHGSLAHGKADEHWDSAVKM